MSNLPFTSRRSAIGVAVSPRCIEAVQLELRGGRRGGRPAVRDAVALARRSPGEGFDAAEAARLAGVLRRRRFMGNDVVLALPNARLVRGLIEVPGNSVDPVAAAAREAERTHGLAPGGYELAAWRPELPRAAAGGGGGGRQAVVCVSGARHADAAPWLEAFGAAGLSVNALDTRACAVSRVLPGGGVGERGEGGEGPRATITAVLDMDHAAAELVLLQGGSVVYQRPLLDSGLVRLYAALGEAGVDERAAGVLLGATGYAGDGGAGGSGGERGGAAALHGEGMRGVRGVMEGYVRGVVAEVEPALGYAARVYPDWPVERLVVVGEAARVRGLEGALREAMGLPGPVLLASDDAGGADSRRLAVAFGMALYPRGAACAAA